MTLSSKAWDFSKETIARIYEHPFNQDLRTGTLSPDIFCFYLEQDRAYLQDFTRAHTLLGARSPYKYIQSFLGYAQEAFVAEEQQVHLAFLEKNETASVTDDLTPATLGYTNYLLRVCSLSSFEIGIAAVLPCFWIYQEVAKEASKKPQKNNPYQFWIDVYRGENFQKAVAAMIDIFDDVALKASPSTREEMIKAFHKSSCFEWHFWNDCYQQNKFYI